MIKATGASTDGRPFLLLGLSMENCRRLVDGKPILVRADHIDPRLPALDVIVMGGETEEAMTVELQRNFPTPEESS